MRKSFIIISAAVLAIASACSKIEVTTSPAVDEVVPAASQTISIPVAMEVSEDTKSYYLETGTTWAFVPETYDQYHYFQMMWGACQDDDYATVTKTQTTTYIDYPSTGLKTGTVLYSYLVQPVFESELYEEAEELDDDANINSDPHAVLLSIPSVQYIDKEVETVYTIIDHSFTIIGPKMANKSIDGGKLTAVPENSLSFKIEGYNPDLNYVCTSAPTGKISDFTVDQDGIASVTVAFNDYDISLGSASQSRTTEVTVAVEGFESNFYSCVNVTATRNRASTRSTYSTKLGAAHNEVISESEEGEVRYLPLRDAMPCVTKGLSITSALLRYPEDIANCMTIYMLGSAVEFNIYSLESGITGQTIERVEFTTPNESCCGRYSYDITSCSLSMTPVEGYQENKITADLLERDYTVASAKESAMPVHMVVSVGTYTTCQFDIITMDANGVEWCYTYQVSDKDFTRSNMKVFNIKLTSAKAVRLDGNGGTDEDEELS